MELTLSILDRTLRRNFDIQTANRLLLEFMKRYVESGSITKDNANYYLEPYGVKIENVCIGCRTDQPNQLAHMDPGGCLYNYESSPSSQE